MYSLFTRATEDCTHKIAQVTQKRSSTLGRNPLYMIAADDKEPSKFLGPRLGVMIHHKGEGKKLGFLRAGGDNSKSLGQGPWHLYSQHGAAHVPKRETEVVVGLEVLFTMTPEDAWEF